MKRTLAILLVLFSLTSVAQELSFEEKKNAIGKVYQLLEHYAATTSLKDERAGQVTDSSIAAFSSLFTAEAVIHDEINDADTSDEVLTTKDKTLKQYVSDVRLNFPTGLNSKILRSNISFTNLAKGEVYVMLENNIKATDKRGLLYLNHDTLKMKIQFNTDFTSAKISSITMVGGKLVCNNCGKPVDKKPAKPEPKPDTCPNDRDCDGVINALDNCPDKKGTEGNNGCPEPASLAFEVSAVVGVGAGANSFGKADFSQITAYDNFKVLSSSETKLKAKVGLGINAGVELTLFFGKNKNVGFGTGINFAASMVSFTADEIKFEYKAQDAENVNFRRILTVKDYKEKLTYTNLSIPLLLKFRTPTSTSKRIGFNFEIGPVVSVLGSAKSTNVSSTMDFEAVYSTSGNNLGYSDGSSANTDWLLTRTAVEKHFTAGRYADVNDYFEKHYAAGYYVGLDKNFNGSAGKTGYKIGAGGLLRLGLVYMVSESVYVTAGVNTLLTYNGTVSKVSDRPFDTPNAFENGVKYNSLLNYTKSQLATQFGVFIGLHFRIVK